MVAIPIVLYTGQALGQNDGYCHILITTAGHIMAGISEQVVTLTRSIVTSQLRPIFYLPPSQ